MSLIKPIDLRDMPNLRDAVQAVIAGKINRIEWSKELNLKLTNDGQTAELSITSGTAEVALRGLPDPNFLSAKLYSDYAIVSLTLTNVRVDY